MHWANDRKIWKFGEAFYDVRDEKQLLGFYVRLDLLACLDSEGWVLEEAPPTARSPGSASASVPAAACPKRGRAIVYCPRCG